jgi:hypothetical protein
MRCQPASSAVPSAHPRVACPQTLSWLAFLCVSLCLLPSACAARRCYTPATAARHLHRKLCVKAHVYKEIKLSDGTRILDVCSPRTSVSNCHFAVVSLNRDRIAVGSLQQLVGQELFVTGKILPVNDRAEVLLTSAKQLRIARAEAPRKEDTRVRKSKFHPNPQLLKGFNATQSRMPIADPAFRSSSRY